ncbi:MAG: zinc-binding dehydrogenase [Anaerolineae bacterium]|jgi:NADPH:quinone reductase-like Zn-dependent oxidoreductase|nr:zinc-binding dehydrogenase [Anaerolineae bacterium]
MRAAILTGHGGPEVVQYVQDLPLPEPGYGQVRLKMAAAALNRLDLFVRAGWKGLNLHFPHVIGSDGAGVVDAVGPGVTGYQPGDRVAVDPSLFPEDDTRLYVDYENQTRLAIIGEHASGFAAEYVVVPAKNLVRVPASFSLAAAAAAGLVYVTAWHSLMTRGGLRAGETVLIVGAGGGVNSASLQIAKLAGATVIVVGSQEAKCEQARALGADVTINRERDPDWARAVQTLTGRRGVDVVVDNVGAATFGSSLRACRIGGRILVVGGTSGYAAELPLNQLFARQVSIIGSTMGTHQDYARVMALVFEGKLNAVIGRVFPLSAARQAQQTLEQFDVFGKVVLDVDNPD